MDNDQLNSIVSFHAVECAYAAISAVQGYSKHKQVAGVAVLFALICQEMNLNPAELTAKAERVAADADTYYTAEVKALRAYIQGELK